MSEIKKRFNITNILGTICFLWAMLKDLLPYFIENVEYEVTYFTYVLLCFGALLVIAPNKIVDFIFKNNKKNE